MTSAVVQRTVGRYEVLGELGRGATSVVHLARQVDLDRLVALKELTVLRAVDPQVTERFLLESRLAGSLTHPNIVTVYEYFEDGGAMFIAMEYLERGSLRPLVGHLSLAQTGGVLDGLLAGLAHAHGRGVVHRDLKPENVLVASAGGVKIADFGIAKALDADSRVTTGGATIGTPAYMAPEQAIASDVGPTADLYAVGVVAYELLAGDVPFHGSDVPMAVMLEHLNAPVPPLRAARPDLSDEVCAWVEGLLAKEPRDRPASAAEAAELLDEALLGCLGPRWRRASRLETTSGGAAHLGGAVAATSRTKPAPNAEAAARRRRSRRLGFAAVAVAAIIAIAAGGLALASLVSDSGSQATSTPRQTTQKPPAEPKARVPTTTLAAIRTRATEAGAVATIRFTGDPISARGIAIRDNDLSDGHAWLAVRQRGIESRVKRAAAGPLAAWVRTARNLVRIDLSAAAGVYGSIRVRRVNGRTVVVTAEKRPPAAPPASGGTTSPGPSPTTGTTTTPPPATTTTETQPPPWATG